jgi:hypothetical protein
MPSQCDPDSGAPNLSSASKASSAAPAATAIDGEKAPPGAPAASIGIDRPLHGAVTIDLVRTAVATPDFTLEVASMAKGKVVSQQVQAALPNAYRGTVEGFPDSLVYIGVGTGSADGLVAGYVEIGDETWWLSSGPDRARRAGLPAMIAHSSALAGQSVAGLACAAPTLAGNEWNPPADGGCLSTEPSKC